MTRLIAAITATALLTACGVDGEPAQPTVNNSVTISNNGVNVGTSVGVGKGPVRLALGLNL